MLYLVPARKPLFSNNSSAYILSNLNLPNFYALPPVDIPNLQPNRCDFSVFRRAPAPEFRATGPFRVKRWAATPQACPARPAHADPQFLITLAFPQLIVFEFFPIRVPQDGTNPVNVPGHHRQRRVALEDGDAMIRADIQTVHLQTADGWLHRRVRPSGFDKLWRIFDGAVRAMTLRIASSGRLMSVGKWIPGG